MRSGGWRHRWWRVNIAFERCGLLLFAAASNRCVWHDANCLFASLLLGKVAFIPGGLGVVEASMVAMFTTLGAVNAQAVVVVLAYRLLSLWIPALIGFLVVVILQRETSQPPSPVGSVAGAG